MSTRYVVGCVGNLKQNFENFTIRQNSENRSPVYEEALSGPVYKNVSQRVVSSEKAPKIYLIPELGSCRFLMEKLENCLSKFSEVEIAEFKVFEPEEPCFICAVGISCDLAWMIASKNSNVAGLILINRFPSDIIPRHVKCGSYFCDMEIDEVDMGKVSTCDNIDLLEQYNSFKKLRSEYDKDSVKCEILEIYSKHLKIISPNQTISDFSNSLKSIILINESFFFLNYTNSNDVCFYILTFARRIMGNKYFEIKYEDF